jgi:FdhE protein
LSGESVDWRDIRARLEHLAQHYPEWQPALPLWEAVLHGLDDAMWEEPVPQLCLDRPVAAPLLAGALCHVDARRLSRWVRSLAKLSRQNTVPGQAALHRVAFQPEDTLKLLEAALCQEHGRLTALAATLGADPYTLAAMAHLAVVPLLHACRRRLAAQLPTAWPYGYCPLCGAWPTLAEVLGLAHTRTLRCARCGVAWRTSWLCCPYCDETDHQRLGVLRLEQPGTTYQIDVCATCNGYLKTHTTLQALPAYAVALEDLATIEFDLAALARGYTRPAPLRYALASHLVASPARRRTLLGWHV